LREGRCVDTRAAAATLDYAASLLLDFITTPRQRWLLSAEEVFILRHLMPRRYDIFAAMSHIDTLMPPLLPLR